MQVTGAIDLFALPRDVRDIIWGENRVMLREERARITTHFVKEVLRELSSIKFPAKSREVAIEGHVLSFIESYGISRDVISLKKKIGFWDPEYYNVLKIDGKTSKLILYTIYDYADNVHYRLCGHKAHKAFISGDFENYLNKEDLYYNDDESSW